MIAKRWKLAGSPVLSKPSVAFRLATASSSTQHLSLWALAALCQIVRLITWPIVALLACDCGWPIAKKSSQQQHIYL